MSLHSKKHADLYDLVLIMRSDVSSNEIDRINEEINNVILGLNGKIEKKEYWGLRNLSYPIKKNSKGHYVFLVFSAPKIAIAELENKLKFTDNIIRYSIIKVDHIDPEPSPILKSTQEALPEINVSL